MTEPISQIVRIFLDLCFPLDNEEAEVWQEVCRMEPTYWTELLGKLAKLKSKPEIAHFVQ